MKYKIIACLLILAVAIGAGCSGQQTDTGEEEAQQDDTEAQVAAPEVEDTPKGEPELEIMAVNLIDSDLEITVKNKGNATAEDVYAGVIAYDIGPNFATYNSYRETDNWPDELYNFINHSIEEGQGNRFTFDTGYIQELNDPNIKGSELYLTGGLITQQYKPTIEPGETVVITTTYFWGYNEYYYVTWMDGQEEDFVLW